MTQLIDIAGPDGTLPAYARDPEDPPAAGAPGLVVVQEIYGVNREVRRVADHYAALGYATVAPDLLHRAAPGRVFGYDERDEAIAAARSLPDEAVADDLAQAVAWLAARAGPAGVALLSFGWGGKYAYAAARLAPVRALAAYYPGNIRQVPAPDTLPLPVLLHFGALDPLTPPALVEQLRDAHQRHRDAAIVVHPQGRHGFANPDRPEYDAASADAADAATLAFLRRTLQPPA